MSYNRELRVVSVLLAAVALVTLFAAGASADWFEGDDYKMHFPQLPDPDGWDVFAGTNTDGTQKVLADDWKCIETGYVSDVHLWGSWKHDDPGQIESVHLSIHDDVPAGADTNPNITWSHPGNLLWERDFAASEIVIIDPYGFGQEGWFNPNTGEVIENDHFTYHQINIIDILDPFIQQEGTIYWLDVTVKTLDSGITNEWGWKTSLEHFNDDAVFADTNAVGGVDLWRELRDPLDPAISLDMAFVITGKPVPEPATCTLMLIGLVGAAVVGRRRR